MALQPESAAPGVTAGAPERAGRNWTDLAFRLGALAGLFLLSVGFALLSPHFLTAGNFANVARQTSVNALLALGLLVVILTGGIDLSVGALLALSMSVLAILSIQAGVDQNIAVLVCLLVGLGLGIVNGLLLTRLHLPHPFISTLGMMNVARGIALVITGAAPVFGFAPGVVLTVGGGDFKIGGGADAIAIPYAFVVVAIAYVAFGFFLNRTVIGRRIYAVGGNPEAARLSGVPVARILVLVYALSGLMSAIAAIVLAGRTNSGYPTAALGAELDAISACIIGGTSFFGGVGTVSGTLIGALIMAVLRNGLNLLNVSADYQTVIIGLVIIGAVYVDVLRRRAGVSA